jgi:hypothetical protein
LTSVAEGPAAITGAPIRPPQSSSLLRAIRRARTKARLQRWHWARLHTRARCTPQPHFTRPNVGGAARILRQGCYAWPDARADGRAWPPAGSTQTE